MLHRFFFFFLLPVFLHAEWDQLFQEDEDPALFHHVNVITGNLSLYLQDVVVQGATPIPLVRTYTSAGASEKSNQCTDLYLKGLRGGFLIQGGWNFLPHANLLIEPNLSRHRFKAYLAEPSGSLIPYTFSHREGDHVIFLKPPQDLPQSAGVISARLNTQNNLLCLNLKAGEAVLYLPNGGVREYSGPRLHDHRRCHEKLFYHLQKEVLPSKHQFVYSYNDKKRITRIAATNPIGTKTYSSVDFEIFHTKTPFHFRANTSDGKVLDYHAMEFHERDYISRVESNCRPYEELSYSPGRKGIGARVSCFTFGAKEQFVVSYFLPPDKKAESLWAEKPYKKDFSTDKVKLLEAQVGENGEKCVIAKFTYQPGNTEVRDVHGLLTRYHHENGQLTSIEYFNEKDSLSSLLRFIWNKGRLSSKVLLTEHHQPLFAKTFIYDDKGNVAEETLWGNLTGNATSSFSLNADGTLSNAERSVKRYKYCPKSNLLIWEAAEDGLTYRYIYKEDTDLLTAKFTCDHEKILVRNFFVYNEDNILTAEIIDDGGSDNLNSLDGVSKRCIKRYEIDFNRGLPNSEVECYLDTHSGKEVVIKKTKYFYCSNYRACREEIYDSNDSLKCTIYTDYDAQGRVLRKTTPTGAENTYAYDSLGNLLEIKEVGSSKKKYTYDQASRPISCFQNNKTTKSTYDAKGRVLTETDTKGNTTKHIYDCFGRCLETQMPAVEDEEGVAYVPTIRFAYDIQGNLFAVANPKNETTHTFYNTLRKPTKIVQKNGAEILHFYNKNGTLARTVYSDKTEAHYTYDLFERMTSKFIRSQGEILSKEAWHYNAFYLLSYTNPKGLTVTYSYDGAGRKIAEVAQGRQKVFDYDSLGFLERTKEGGVSHVEKHDIEGKIIELWDEDADGKVENQMRFFYNEEGRKVKAIRITSQGEVCDHFSYDDEGMLISHRDPENKKTQFVYAEKKLNELNQCVLQKIVIDAISNSTIETYDSSNRLVCIQKKDSEGNEVAREDYFYDKAGNKAKRISFIYNGNEPSKPIMVRWEYDALGSVIKEVEAGQKTTLFTYDIKGRLFSRILPSGISFSYAYDGLDRLVEMKSSDGSIHYSYFYDKDMNPIVISDHVQKNSIKRKYNLFGELLEEINALGHHLKWEYDSFGRCTHFILPDASSINYHYSGSHLVSIERKNKEEEVLYEHGYTQFDKNGHVSKEELIYNLGPVKTMYDLLERPCSQISSWIQQSIFHNESNLVSSVVNSFLGNKEYSYDALNQLTKESNREYCFDSLGNPAKCEINNCNQILSKEGWKLNYDENGNLIHKSSSQEQVFYTYDALGRLTSITYPQKRKIHYFYDPLSRLIAKQVCIENVPKREKLYYLYDDDLEMGVLNEKGQILELKVMGLGIKGDIGSAIALEFKDQVFAPLHDFSGNIIALVSKEGLIAEVYNFTAFGEETIGSTLNPWRFSSKRSEEGLIFFGMRFYDPSLGRWLSPDPAGFKDGSNLYAYVHNSPLNRLDLFGLSSESIIPYNITFQAVTAPPSNPWHFEPNMHGMLHCKMSCNGVKTDCFIFSKTWHQFQFAPEEVTTGQLKIIDHLKDFLPKEGRTIGISMLMNGINTSREELIEMGQSLYSKIPENHLLFAIYNPSQGVPGDLLRAHLQHAWKKETSIIRLTRQFMIAVIDSLHKINPELLLMSTTHSNGGLVQLRAAQGMTPDQKSLLRQHLIYRGLGPQKTFPERYAYDSMNIWSKKDHVTGRFRESSRNPNYNVQLIPCLSSWREKTLYIADHAFMSPTYENAVKDNVLDLKYKYGFYDYQNR